MEFDDIVVCFNILDVMKHPSEDHLIFHIDIIDDAVDGHISNFHPLHCMKYVYVFELSEFACIGVDFDSYCYSDSDFDIDSAVEVHMHLIVMLRYRLWNSFLPPLWFLISSQHPTL